MGSELEGALVALVTPFENGQVDLAAFSNLVEWHLASGTSGLVIRGTTGEAATLHPAERESLCRRAIEICEGKIPIIAGTGTNATWSTVMWTRAAVQWGVDAVLIVTPYYNKPTQRGLLEHYKEAAAAAAGTAVIPYDVPGRTGVTIAEETVHELAKIPGVVAFKDATHDVERAGRLARDTSLTILSGDDALTLSMMREGAKGVISVVANVVPEQMARLCADRDTALHERLVPLFKASFAESNPIPVKFALAETGRIRNELRLPLTPLAPEHHETVRSALAQAQG